ncbi:MAG: hypothetical protein J7M14_02120 [Planctomycetes bacterium]|nr:hypothetical protein [Planctomycetota bacterium]
MARIKMLYLAFTFWLFLIVFAGIGACRMLARLIPPPWTDWALLPGTIVSEMGYIFGCLITGGEVRRAKLMSNAPKSGKSANGTSHAGAKAASETAQKLKRVGPIVSALTAMVACLAAIMVIGAVLGRPVIEQFAAARVEGVPATLLPTDLPATWEGFWTCVADQSLLMRRVSEAWAEAEWLNWRIPVFVYAALCLAIRLAPAGRTIRPTLAATAIISAVVALAGLAGRSVDAMVLNTWPLLTYIWASLLLLLTIILLVRGTIFLTEVLLDKQKI